MDFFRVGVVVLICLFPMLCSGQISGECLGSLLSEDEIFRNCTYMILPVVQQTLATDQGDRNPGTVLFENLCSVETRPYLDCFVSSMSQCPDELAGFISTIGIDPADFFEFGGFDLPCSIFVGQCTSVKQCFPQIKLDAFTSVAASVGTTNQGETATTAMAEIQSNFTTPLTEFYRLIKRLCGFMKLEYDCAMTEFEKCSDSIVETLDRQVPLFVADILIADSHMNFSVLGEDIISLLENDCPSTNVQLMTNSCSLAGLDSQQFMNCYDNAMLAYENDKNGCILQDVLTYCTQRHIGNNCNAVATTYLVEQLPLFLRLNGMECIVSTAAPTVQQLVSNEPFTVIRPSGPATNDGVVNQMATNGNGNINQMAAGQNSKAATMSRYQSLYLLLASSLFFSLFRSI